MKTEKKVLEQVSETMQMKGYANKTQQLYIKWIKEYILFHKKKSLEKLGINEIEHFKSYIEHTKIFSYELKKEATQAIFFLYTQVLGINLRKEYLKATQNLNLSSSVKKQKLVQSVMVF